MSGRVGRVVLVADLPDDLLEQVLERDDAGRAAVLVDHHGQVRARVLQVAQQVVQGPALGHGDDAADERRSPGRGALLGGQAEHVLHVDQAHDVVEVGGEDGEPGVAGGDGRGEQLGRRSSRRPRPRPRRRGTMASSAVFSAKRSDRVSSVTSSGSARHPPRPSG